MPAAVYSLSVTTQGPLYPPSEIMDVDGNFVVIGRVPRKGGTAPWAAAIVSERTRPPVFGELGEHDVLRWVDLDGLGLDAERVLYTLPLPLPANNYPMLFAPDQRLGANNEVRPSYPLHEAPIPDLRPEDGRRPRSPITLGQWVQARGELAVLVSRDARTAMFELAFEGLIADSVYTVMSLRQRDLDPLTPTRPGPLGVPNVFVTDDQGAARFWAQLPDPFPAPNIPGANRIINVVVLYMSSQMSYGGAIGWYGLGGDIHAHLKLQEAPFSELRTRS